jgi:hypothetical protein
MTLYKSFAKYNKGYFYIMLIFLMKIIWMGFNAASNLWVVKWTEASSDGSEKHPEKYYLTIYIVLGLFYGTFAFIRALLIAISTPAMSEVIHESIISNLLFSSLN